jgi:hypothetical protein
MAKEEKSSNTIKGVIAAVVVALAAGGTTPWWAKGLFSKSPKAETSQSTPPETSETASKGRTKKQTPDSGPTANLPDLLSYVPIWDAIPKLKAAGFNSISVDLKRDETIKYQNKIMPGGIVTAVSDADGKQLWAGQSYPANTRVRIKVQSDPSWNQPARLYSEPSEVSGLTDFIRQKELESERAAKKQYLSR